MSKLDTAPYKGVRDFYPEEQAIQNYIFDTWKEVSKSFDYEEYSASLLEPADLYKNKTSEEIVSQQMFVFKDRGSRDVALRPEMTPTLARMVAAKRKSLKFPLRWFSIPNLFRYERPQRGRRREHWQLNCDLMGVSDITGEVEIITLAHSIMAKFGAKNEAFTILVNDRKAQMKGLRDAGITVSTEDEQKLLRLRDSKDKMDEDEYREKIREIAGQLIDIESEESEDVKKIISLLSNAGISNVEFSSTLTRGFDYYTGIVFEIFDNDPENNRSLFGGGRYDNLLEIFDVEPVPAVGFGMGDITMRDFLEKHKLGPYA